MRTETGQAPDLRHHGDREVVAGLVDLAVNVRRTTPPKWLAQVLADSLRSVAAYPDSATATSAVAARHGCSVDEVLVTSGAAEAFTLVARALRPGLEVHRPVVVHPQFTEPERALRQAGHAVHRVLLRADEGFTLHDGDVPAEADLVVVGNPTNPTSVLHPGGTVRALARPGRVLVVDEAFLDGVPGEPGSLAGVRDLPGVLVVRSLTKTWGLAGLRAGYVVGDRQLVGRLAEAQPPWSVSTPALAATVACCSVEARAEADRHAIQGLDEARATAELLSSRGFTVFPPGAPFVLAHHPHAAQLRVALREKGFVVRRGDTFPGLDPEYVRVAARGVTVREAFAAALDACLDDLDPAHAVQHAAQHAAQNPEVTRCP